MSVLLHSEITKHLPLSFNNKIASKISWYIKKVGKLQWSSNLSILPFCPLQNNWQNKAKHVNMVKDCFLVSNRNVPSIRAFSIAKLHISAFRVLWTHGVNNVLIDCLYDAITLGNQPAHRYYGNIFLSFTTHLQSYDCI